MDSRPRIIDTETGKFYPIAIFKDLKGTLELMKTASSILALTNVGSVYEKAQGQNMSMTTGESYGNVSSSQEGEVPHRDLSIYMIALHL